MNPRQRRGAVLMILTAVGAVAVFVAVLGYVANVRSQVGDMVQVLEMTTDVDAYQAITPSMYKVVEVPKRWTTDATLHDASDVSGLVAAAALANGSVLQKDMVISPPSVQAGFREIAILVDAETGVAGKVKPGDHVDIIATIAGDKEQGTTDKAEIWVSNALVLNVGVVEQTSTNDQSGNLSTGQGVPVTFALSAQDALRVAYVESFSTKLRLALRGDGDSSQVPTEQQTFGEG